ncbi:restriction endonuclease subunit S [Acinetobacter faecalis]|uniref:Restriction endonuclease subunit S n=1 Tax=Acinetobacter faecalis TaxID=2665161 RepID=A0AB35UXP9_9GAMM|nr:restriction endonuclease subunit S [Acinetobacter faecalis]MDY6487228.1 restriction endonuclease subunit S [Acinetobacter faecalis]
MTAPKLRFKEFDGDWSSNPLGEIIGISSASRVFKEQWQDSGVPFFRTSDVVSIFKNKDNEKAYISLELFEELAKKSGKIKKGDLLVTGGGSIGIPYLVPNDQPLYFKDADLLWLKAAGIIEGSFLYNFFISPKFREYLKSISHTGTISHFTIEQAKTTPFNYPSKPEQTKIASFLSAVDEKISQLNQKHALLSQYKQGMMQKLFSQQIRFKADDGSVFRAWEEKKLGEIGIFLKGKGISKADIVDDGKLPCIRYGELYTRYKEIISHVFSATNLDSKNLVLSKANDVLIPASGETQVDIATASCVLEDNIALSGDLNIYRTKENGIFLSYLIRSHLKMQIAQLAQGNSVVHLYSSQLKGVQLNLPCLEEQTKIAEFLSAIDQKIEVVAQQIQQAKTWKKGLLQQMFV